MIAESLKKAQKFIASGNLAKAESLCTKILKKDPQQVDALHLLGIIALNKNQFEKAIQIFGRVLQITPNHAVNCYNLGIAYSANGQSDLAVKHLQTAIKLQPDMACAHRDLCAALKDCGNFERAVQAGRTAVTLAPKDPGANYNLAAALHEWRDFEAAFEYYKQADRLAPGNPTILFDLAQVYLGRGETDAARDCFRQVIKRYPREIESHRQLMRLSSYETPDHEDIARIKAMENETWLSNNDRTAIYFMLSKAYKDCGLYDEAFAYALKGNRIQDQEHQFNPDEFADYISALINFYTPERISELSKLGHQTKTPIFIVGTPRSGTTLTEQILCSHQDVFGAGELDWVTRCVNALPDYLESSKDYPACAENMTEKAAADLGSKYLRYLNSLASGQPRITDKMPGNFLHLGFIHILFPNAHIIHCQREPRDACISMFLEYFPGVVSYSYDLYKLGAYYSQYLRLMEHWWSVLPEDAMLELEYESMVQNQEAETRRLLAFLDLEWDEACLAFHKKKRRVFTASHLQVTQPLYSSSVGRWKIYQKHLQPLEEGFKYLPRH